MRVAAFPTAFMYGRRKLTQLEMAVYAAICAVLIAAFLYTGLQYMELAEKTAMDVTISVATTAVNNQVALAMLRGRTPAAGQWTGRNPFEITGKAPDSFQDLGARELPVLERPAWTFDARSGELIYLPRLHWGLRTSTPDGAVRFRLVPQAGGVGYKLVSTSEYSWHPI